MRVLLDENINRKLKKEFDDCFYVTTVTEHGWNGKKNGDLIRAAEIEFDVFVTMDKSIAYQQNLYRIDLGIILISARSNRREDVLPAIKEVNMMLRQIQSGELIRVKA